MPSHLCGCSPGTIFTKIELWLQRELDRENDPFVVVIFSYKNQRFLTFLILASSVFFMKFQNQTLFQGKWPPADSWLVLGRALAESKTVEILVRNAHFRSYNIRAKK